MADHYTPNGGKNSSNQGWQYQDPGQDRSPNNNKKTDFRFTLREWIPIIILFCIPSGITQAIAFFWAIGKLINRASAKQKKTTVSRAATKTAASKKAAGKKPKGGNGLIAGGSVLTAIFGMGTIGSLATFLESLSMGYFFSDELTGVIFCALFLAGGLAMLFRGIGNKRRAKRYLNYLAYIGGNQQIDLAHMAASFGVPARKLFKDLRKMLEEGILPKGYLDLAAGKLFLTDKGYQAPKAAPQPEPKQAEAQAKNGDDAILKEIRQVNDDIPDEVMSAKIDRIEEITGKILAYQKARPDKAGQLRSFLNYYLPTTLKILRAYAQLDAQGIEGENISAAKHRIEGMMDQVVSGFEKQLDKLFQDDAMDISSDVQVLENMLKKDGLSDGESMTMTL